MHETSPGVEAVINSRGVAPAFLPMDNGTELTANALRDWCRFARTETAYIEPGSPWENSFIESFNGKLRDLLLGGEVFETPFEAEVLAKVTRTIERMNKRTLVQCVQHANA